MTTTAAAIADRPDLPPEPCLGLEEAVAADPRDWGPATAFALLRAWRDDGRPLASVVTTAFRRERGALSARGLLRLGIAPSRLLQVRADREAEALWALEEALKSGVVCGGVATVESAPFVATRRLDFAARSGGATGVLLRVGRSGELSAARRRWRIAARPAAPDLFDPRAPGGFACRAELVRRRDGPAGAWDLEQEHETHRLGLAAGLADHGLVQGGRARAA